MNSVTMMRKFSRNRYDDLEPAPDAAEALDDQPRVADAGHRAEPDHHLLVDDQHGTAAAAPTAGWCRSSGPPASRSATPPASLSPTITISPGPMIASSASSRERRPRWPSSCRRIVPKAPWMSPDVGGVEHGRARARVDGARRVRRGCSPCARPPFLSGRDCRGRREVPQSPGLDPGARGDVHRRQPRACYFAVARLSDMRWRLVACLRHR